MNTNKDGGHAFPTTFVEPNIGGTYSGMSLRDYFAAAALPATYEEMTRSDYHSSCWVKSAATYAYKLADAMLAERAKQGGGK